MKLLPFRSPDSSASAHAFETRCEDCNVSFPAETKKCLHCGQRLGSRAVLGDPSQGAHFGEPAGEQEVTRWAPLRMIMGGVWVAIVLLVSVLRACWEGGGA